MLYVDTSILVAALTREPATGRMQAWLADQAAGVLAISEWVLTEFSVAMSVKVRTGQLAAP
ncbi:MAG: type II toxin-antitoxin system VapC family toxin, partial [Porticoccaceae bacterium]